MGVVAGVAAVALTGWEWLDPVIALLVAANIIWAGFHLVRRSLLGLLDTALPGPEQQQITAILERYGQQEGIAWHALRTRAAGSRRFVSVHLLIPDEWTIRQGHALSEQVEQDIRAALESVTLLIHLEPLHDPTSMDDTMLDRA